MTAEEMLKDGSLGVEQARAFSGLGRSALYELMGQGRLPYVKCGARRLIPRRALVQVLAEGLSAGRHDEKSAERT
jgi:excisionase family DNA binding protein